LPELPEMVNYVRQLEPLCTGKAIHAVAVARPRALNVAPEELNDLTVGRRLTAPRSFGKHLILGLDDGASLVCHLMLDGYLRFAEQGEPDAAHPQIQLQFDDASTLGFYRIQLGHVHYHPTQDLTAISDLQGLGPDPLAPGFTPAELATVLRGRRAMVKALLMDQARIAGLGNRYSDEALFTALIRPDRPVNALSLDEIDTLHAAIIGTLQRAIDAGGGSQHPLHTGDRVSGGARGQCRVAGREGQPCLVCGHTLDVKRIGGRQSCFCPFCQT
jgi:formamidopyrimidine-DNA glycosylase